MSPLMSIDHPRAANTAISHIPVFNASEILRAGRPDESLLAGRRSSDVAANQLAPPPATSHCPRVDQCRQDIDKYNDRISVNYFL
jgi:hypothetical protein